MNNERRPLRPYPSVAAFPPARDAHGPHGGDWEIAIYGDLTDKQPDLINKLVEVPRKSRGTIFFDSCGGSAYVGLGLASIIRLRGLDAVGVVAAECSSAAILPFAACNERYVTPHATLLFHPVRWHSEENVRLEEASEWARHFEVMERDMDQLLSRFFNFPAERLTAWTRPGRFVSGAEMVEAGLAKAVDLFSGDIWSQIRLTANPQRVADSTVVDECG